MGGGEGCTQCVPRTGAAGLQRTAGLQGTDGSYLQLRKHEANPLSSVKLPNLVS